MLSSSSSVGCVLNNTSICQLSTCVRKISGLASNSSSPSDTWLIEFQNGTKYVDASGRVIDIPEAFCKLFIEPKSLEDWLESAGMTSEMKKEWNPRLQQLEGLEYELSFYAQIVDEILQSRKSPHFVRLFSAGSGCSFKDLVNTLEKGGVPFAESSLARNLYYTFRTDIIRPAITNSTIPKWPENWGDFKFAFMLSQKIDTKYSVSLSDWIQKSGDTPNFMANLLLILFQLCQACYALYLEDACHNDLHSGNVWITTRNDIKKNILYIVGDITYIFPQVTIMSRIFDFDRAYAKKLGPNHLLAEKTCANNGHCNKVLEPKDFVKLLCYVVSQVKSPLRKHTLRNLLYSERTYESDLVAFDKFMTNSKCFFSTYLIPQWNDATFAKFASYPEILASIYRDWKRVDIGGNYEVEIDETFVLAMRNNAALENRLESIHFRTSISSSVSEDVPSESEGKNEAKSDIKTVRLDIESM